MLRWRLLSNCRIRQTVVEHRVCWKIDNKYNIKNDYRYSEGNELNPTIQSNNRWWGMGMRRDKFLGR